ncbi:hypothetical protein Bca101_056188 [Brassica carinata]
MNFIPKLTLKKKSFLKLRSGKGVSRKGKEPRSCWSPGRLVLLRLFFRRVSCLAVRYLYIGFRFNGCNGHGKLEWRRQSPGWLDERRHRHSVVLSRAVGSLAVRCFEFVRVWILHPGFGLGRAVRSCRNRSIKV